MQREVLDCLDSDLDFEEWVMDQEEAALDDADDDFDEEEEMEIMKVRMKVVSLMRKVIVKMIINGEILVKYPC